LRNTEPPFYGYYRLPAFVAKVRELVGPNRQPSSSSRQSAYGAQGLPTGDGLEAGQHE